MTWLGWNANAVARQHRARGPRRRRSRRRRRGGRGRRGCTTAPPRPASASAARDGRVVAEPELRAQLPLAHDVGEEVLRAQPLGRAARRRGRRRGPGRGGPRAVASIPRTWCRPTLAAGSGAPVEDRLGAVQAVLALVEPPVLDQQGRRAFSSATPTNGSVDHPSALRDRDRLRAAWCSARSSAARQVRHRAERRQAPELDVRAARARRASPSAVLEVRLRVGEPQRPALGDAEVHQRERLELGAGRRPRPRAAARSPRRRPRRARRRRRARRSWTVASAVSRAVAALRGSSGSARCAAATSASASAQRDSREQVGGRDRRQLARRRRRCSPGRAASSAPSVASSPSSEQVDPVAAEQLAGELPVAAELRRGGSPRPRCPCSACQRGGEPVQPAGSRSGASRRSSSRSRSASRWW